MPRCNYIYLGKKYSEAEYISVKENEFSKITTLYRSGLNLADKSPYLSTLLSQGKKSDYAPLIERYKNGDKTALQEEALAMAIGDMGERMVQRNMKNAFLEWVDKMWTAIKRVFGGRLTDMTPEQLNRLTFKQFSNLVAGQLLAGDPVSGELVVQMINNYRGKKPLSDPEFRNIYEESKKLKKEYGDTDNYTKFQVLPDGSKVGVGLPLFQIIGEKGAVQLDNAPNIVQAAKRLDNLEVAKNMESKGADARTIFLATGWQKGGDGKWKTEIGDITFNNLFEGDNPIAMQIEDNGFIKLGDLVSGEVLDAYPYLKDVPVKFVKGTPGNGQYDGNEIKLQYKSEMDFIINEQVLLKALAHEVQHYVQDQEGFAKGTTSDYFTEDKLNYMTQLVYEDFIFRNLEYDEYIKQHGNAVESVLEPLDEWEDFQKEAKKGKDNVIKILADAKRHSLSKYRKVAGEVEANNVMKRMDMPLSERLVKTFTDTEDVAEDEKIYLFDSKVSNSTFDLNKYNAEKRRERAEDNVNKAKANLFNAWNNLKTVGVVSDPWQNSQNMKRVIDAAIELAIQVGAKTKEEIKAALNDVIKKHNLSPNQLNNIARAVKAYSEPFDQDIFNDIVQNTDSAHEAFGFLRLMRQNTKDPIKYGKVLKLEDELTKRQIEYEESQQVPEGTENNTKAEILKSFGEALTSYKMPLSQPKDVAITGAYNPLIDNEVFGTTMQASMLHATGFVKNWFDLFKARDISTKAFFQEVADYLAANPGSIYSEPIANASYRLLAELKRGYKNDKYWDSIYDIMNIPAQAQRRSNLGIALALGSQESSGHAFSGKLEAIEQFKAGLNENLTDEELDENNHGEIKRLGAEIHEEEGNRRPIPPPGYLQRKARRAYKEVEQSVINRVKEKIKGCK